MYDTRQYFSMLVDISYVNLESVLECSIQPGDVWRLRVGAGDDRPIPLESRERGR